MKLSTDALLEHVRVLANDIGPRPTGHPQETQARAYIRRVLTTAGFSAADIEEMPLKAWDTWGYATVVPQLLALLGSLSGRLLGRRGHLIGGLLSLAGAYQAWRLTSGNEQFMPWMFQPQRDTANVLVRISATEACRHRVVLIGHTDSNKARPSFGMKEKHLLIPMATLGVSLLTLNGLLQLARATAEYPTGTLTAKLQKAHLAGIIAVLLLMLYDESGPYIDGANDNATAVACLLGLAAQLNQQPLRHTEVWVVFTAAEEVGCLGIHALLDKYGTMLRNAWFIDFEMVGTDKVVYVTEHSSLIWKGNYTPDSETIALAHKTAQLHPELGITGEPMVIIEEVASLRKRGYRGMCIAGKGKDGWLANWHQITDDFEHIVPSGIERAARFALAMMHTLDSEQN